MANDDNFSRLVAAHTAAGSFTEPEPDEPETPELKALLDEQEQCRARLVELRRLIGRKRQQPPQITFTVTAKDFHDAHNLAFHYRSSVSQVCQLALVRLLKDVETGQLPLPGEYQRGIDPGHA